MQSFKKYTWRAALLLTLGLGSTACEKAVDIAPYNSLDASTGFKTPADVNAGLIGAYNTLQSANYYGLRYPLFADLQADNARWTGTFPTFNQVAINSILTDNVELTNIWNAIYTGINNCNYIIQQADLVNDATFNKQNAIAEARALRAFHYMSLLAWWGGTPQGYGYSGGLGVPLRLTPTTNITDGAINPIARSSETDVNAAIRADLAFAATNLALVGVASTSGSQKSRISQAAVLALRARFELRQRDYAAAASFAQQALTTAGVTNTSTLEQYSTIFSQKYSGESLWELDFNPTDQSSFAFFWFAAARGGRGEIATATALPSAYAQQPNSPTDLRRPVNVVLNSEANSTYASNATRKYFRINTQDDNFQMIRLGEVILTLAEAQAQQGNLTQALANLNRIRSRAGILPAVIATPPNPLPVPATAVYLAPTTSDPTGQTALINQILTDRRLELANEGMRWFDLRRTNTVQTVLTTTTQTYRNLWPIPQREVLNSVPVGQSASLVTQNPGY